MRFAVVTLKRSKTGLWTARKVIPERIRAAYGKREEKQSWPASLSAGQAKAELASWLAPIEDKIALLRGAAGAAPLSLTKRQCRSLAGQWYRERVENEESRFTDSSGVWDWDVEIEAILPEDEPHEPGITRLHPIPAIVEQRDAFLIEQGLRLDDRSADQLLQEMLDLHLDFLRLMQRRVAGDFGPDPVLETLPKEEIMAAPKAKPKVSITDLFNEFEKTGSATPHTLGKWRNAVKSFVQHVGHDDATLVTRADAHAWFASLLARGLSTRTIRSTYRSALARVLKVAHNAGRLDSNPFNGLEVIGPKPVQTKRKGLTEAEAKVILKAALGPQPEGLSPTFALARRWVPWICAYTGARVNEITQLRAMDIKQEDGVWVFHITPEAGSVKTHRARSVPIHSCLIEQGVLELAKVGDPTPLFYDPSGLRKGSDKHPLHTQVGSKLAKWVRSLGVTEVESPNHGWRHRFKTMARRVGMDPEARDVIQGHVPITEGGRYGEWSPDMLKPEVEKLGC